MAENSNIEWTDNTFNPWVGCFKVSPGCKHCYAETLMTRKGRWANTWGPPETTERIRTSPANWAKPLQWEKQARAEGRRIRVFCSSLADVFERNDQLLDWRWDLWSLVAQTPNLDWQILTKRPENVLDMTPHFWHKPEWEGYTGWPANVWIGTSVEDQRYADERIPELLKIPAAVRFLSVEPLLEPVQMLRYLLDGAHKWQQKIHWVIVGAESGQGARPMDEDWVRSLRDQCVSAGVAFFYKQNAIHGKKISIPEIDGRRWVEFPISARAEHERFKL